MRTALAKVIRDLRSGENIDLYLTIVISVTVALLGAFQVANFEIISGVLLAVIALIATSLLANRRGISDLKDASQQLKASIEDLSERATHKASISDVLREGYPDFKGFLQNARAVSVLGAVLSTSVSRHNSDFVQLLNRNGKLRLIISEPTVEVLKFQAFRSSTVQDNDFLVSTTNNSMKTIKAVKERANNSTRIELRSIPYVPAYSIVVIEDVEGRKNLFVRLTAYKISAPEQPTFQIDNVSDPKWFHFFEEQFEELWKVGSMVEL